MNEEFDKIRAINQFKSSLTNKEEYGNDGFQFKGLVNYQYRGTIVREVLDVILIIGGYSPEVKIDTNKNGKKITEINFHMDFSPRFRNTDFEYDSNRSSLIISGNSQKMGKYKVEITEM